MMVCFNTLCSLDVFSVSCGFFFLKKVIIKMKRVI